MTNSTSTDAAIEARIRQTRAELEATIGAIEDHLDLKKQVSKLTAKVQSSYRRSPLPWIVGTIAIAAAAAGVIVLVRLRR